MQSKSPISAVIITKNEERHIERCIQSLLPLTDDIIIIDSESTDGTAEICKKYPVTFIVQPWSGFSNAKNTGNQKAKYDYILSIDGDEEVSKELFIEIQNELKNPQFKVYNLPFMTNFCGEWIRHGAWFPESHVRIFDKRSIQWQGDIHEKLSIPENEKIGQLKKGFIHHYTIEYLDEYIAKINHYTSLHAQNMFERGKKASFIKLYLAPTFSFIRDYVFKCGFLDGIYGYTIAKQSANYVFIKYMKLRLMHEQAKRLKNK